MVDESRPEQAALLDFTQWMFPRYRVSWHHRLIAQHLERIERGDLHRLIITMPPRHGKSELASVHFPAWYLGRNPDKRVIACSNTARLANKFSRLARNKISNLKWVFPKVQLAPDLKNVESWDLAGFQGGYMAAGIGGQVTGFGGDLLVVDDPVKSAEQADSETYRENTWEWYSETLRTRLEPGGAIVVIGTRWHEDDMIGRLIAQGGWEVLHLPAIDDEGEPLWPDRWPLAALLDLKKDVGSRGWEAQFQGRPQPSEGGMFKRHWWRYWQPRGSNMPPVDVKMPDGSVRHVYAEELPAWWFNSAQSWDMTFKETKSGSYVVGLVGATHGPNGFLLDLCRDRMEFTDAVRAVRKMTSDHPDIGAKLIEDKANGPAVISTLQSEIAGILPIPVEGSKEARAASATPRVEAGNWYLPHPDLPGAEWVPAFIHELASFPTGAHDDQVDAFSQLDRYLMAWAAYDESDDVIEQMNQEMGG